jgi:Chaperone of endosialidase
MKKIFLLPSFIVIFISGYAQAPVNDDPCGAIDVPVVAGEPILADCLPTIVYSYTNASLTPALPNPSCVTTGSAVKDVWYKFTVPASGSFVIKTANVNPDNINDIVLSIFSNTSCTGVFTQIACNDDFPPGVYPRVQNSATAGQVMYIRIFMLDGSASAEFKMCVSDYSINNNPVVDNTNKIGIGTQTPLAKLDVAGTGLFRDKVIFVKDVELRAGLQLSNNAGATKVLTSDGIGNASWQLPLVPTNYWSLSSGSNIYNNNGANVGINLSGPTEKLHVDGNIKLGNQVWVSSLTDRTIKFGDGNLVSVGERFVDDQLHIYGALDIVFRTANDLERMRIDQNGKVGIGTTSPSNKLTVAGDADFTGNVGIGTTTPTSKLTVSGQLTVDQKAIGGYGGLLLKGNVPGSNYPNIAFTIKNNAATPVDEVAAMIQGDLQNNIAGAETVDLTFLTSQTGLAGLSERFRIKGNGNVGIGNAAPHAQLQFSNSAINRKLVLWETFNNDHQYYGFGINAAALRYQVDGTSSSHVFYAGATATTSNELFRIIGNGNAILAGTLTQSSDKRLKKNIAPLQLSLNKLLQLNGYTYNWISKDKDPNEQIGLMAQEVQKLYPQLVSEIKKENGETSLAVNYIGLIPVMVESIKEQQKQIGELKQLVQKLLNK